MHWSCSVPSLSYIVKSFVALLILWSLQLVFVDKSTSLPGFDQLLQLVSVLESHIMQGIDVTMPVTVHDACTQLCMPACPVKVHIRLAMMKNFPKFAATNQREISKAELQLQVVSPPQRISWQDQQASNNMYVCL